MKTQSNNAELLNRMPPADLAAECMTVGSALLDPAALDDLALTLRPDDFHSGQWSKLFRHLVDMRSAGLPIDAQTLVDHLRSAGELEAAGGAAAIAEAFQSVAVAAHAKHYAEIVRRNSIRRALRRAGEEMIRQAHDATADVDKLLDESEMCVLAVRERGDAGRMVRIQEGLLDLTAALDRRMRDGADGLKTGFADLDERTGGFRESQLIILAARTGCGKTALALNVAANAAAGRLPVAMFSLEMSREELTGRLVCSWAGLDSHAVRAGRLSREGRERFAVASNEIARFPLWVDDTPIQTVAEIAASCRRLKRTEGLALVIVDYLQLIEPDDPKAPRQEQVARASRRLKALAKEVSAPVLCLCQLNRQADGAEPRLSHLRESGAIEQDADVVLLLHTAETKPDEHNRPAEIELRIAKQRSGPTGSIKLAWDGATTTFRNHAKPHHLEPYAEFADFA